MIKPLAHWKYEEIELNFGLERINQLPTLNTWLQAKEPVDDFEKETLNHAHQQIFCKSEAWNEAEMKHFFVARIINLVNFSKPKTYAAFCNRDIALTLRDIHQNDIPLRGRIEFFVALGEQIPRQPFFFLNEYKPLTKTTPSDPLGQLLIAMLSTQSINTEPAPLYGAYIIGEFWQFVVLDGQKYAVSKSFDATDKTDLFQIFSILKRCKVYIEERIATIPGRRQV